MMMVVSRGRLTALYIHYSFICAWFFVIRPLVRPSLRTGNVSPVVPPGIDRNSRCKALESTSSVTRRHTYTALFYNLQTLSWVPNTTCGENGDEPCPAKWSQQRPQACDDCTGLCRSPRCLQLQAPHRRPKLPSSAVVDSYFELTTPRTNQID